MVRVTIAANVITSSSARSSRALSVRVLCGGLEKAPRVVRDEKKNATLNMFVRGRDDFRVRSFSFC